VQHQRVQGAGQRRAELCTRRLLPAGNAGAGHRRAHGKGPHGNQNRADHAGEPRAKDHQPDYFARFYPVGPGQRCGESDLVPAVLYRGGRRPNLQ